MLTYDDLVTGLEDAWLGVGLHEHSFVESVVPATTDRTLTVELFPEHEEPLTAESMPPWLDLSYTWSAVHQLLSEGRTLLFASLLLADQLIEKRGVQAPPPAMPPDPQVVHRVDALAERLERLAGNLEKEVAKA